MPVQHLFFHGSFVDLKTALASILTEEKFDQQWTCNRQLHCIKLDGLRLLFKQKYHGVGLSYGKWVRNAKGLGASDTKKKVNSYYSKLLESKKFNNVTCNNPNCKLIEF